MRTHTWWNAWICQWRKWSPFRDCGPGRHVSSSPICQLASRELKQQRRRRQRKRHWKSLYALLQTLSRLFQLVQFVKCLQIFLELNSKDCIKVLGQEKESPCLVVLSSTKREIRHFHVLVMQRQQRNVPKSVVHVQSCCFANLNLLLFFLFWLLSLSLLPKLPNAIGKTCLSYLQLPSLETQLSRSLFPHVKTSGVLFQRF